MELFLALLSLGEFNDPRLRRNSYRRPGYSSPSNQNKRPFRLMLDMIACQNSLQEEFQILSESALYDSFDNVVSLAYPLPFFFLFLFYSFF